MTKKYHARLQFSTPEETIRTASDEDVGGWAKDPNCIEQELCIKELASRAEQRAAELEAKRLELIARRKGLEDFPFDPRTEISADAEHIASRVVTHLWIIFVLLPFVLGLCFIALKSILAAS